MKYLKLLLLLVISLSLLYCWAAGIILPLKEPFDSSVITYAKNSSGPFKDNLKLITYNIAYGRGLKDDAGDLRDKKTIEGFLDSIAIFLKKEDADIVALQEVDFNSKRTWYINELDYLAKKCGYPYAAYVITWNKNYIPYPWNSPSQYYGQMLSGQAIMSKYEIVENEAIALPKPSENNFFYNNFYLERHIQKAKIKVSPALSLNFYNNHLEAFSNDNRMEQAKILRDLLLKDKGPKLISGDFNALPAEAMKRINFTDEPEADFTEDKTMDFLTKTGDIKEIISPEI